MPFHLQVRSKICHLIGALPRTHLPDLDDVAVKMRLVETRPSSRVSHQGGRAWFLAPEGRAVVRLYGSDVS